MASDWLLLGGTTVVHVNDHTAWVAIAAVAVAAIAVVIAAATLVSDRFYRRRDALSKLLDRFEAGDFYVLMWRGERIGRPAGEQAWSLEEINLAELKSRAASDPADARRINQLLGEDPGSDRAAMHEMYFFALQTHAWLSTATSFPSFFSRGRMTRLINETFGYQLLSTLLDYRTIACRLRRADRTASYYAEQWGCLDETCRDLVRKLCDELLDAERDPALSPGVAQPLGEKWNATERALDELGVTQ